MARKEVKRNKLKFNFKNINTPLVLGIALIFSFIIWRYHNLRILSFNAEKVSMYKNSGIKPSYIKSYPVGVDVKVGDASINDGVWTILPDSVSYLVDSAGLGDGGNIIMYGHNRDNILGPIRWIKEGAVIEVTGNNNLIYKYEVVKTDVVGPDNLDYIKDTQEETLTLYTCTDFLDSKRFIVVAKPVRNNIPNKDLAGNSEGQSYVKSPVIDTKVESSTIKPVINVSYSSTPVYITYYGFNDNDPPGKAIAYPKSSYSKSKHDEASGVGTYDNPVTFASDPELFSVGTIIYIPYIKKYAIMEDLCVTCSKNYKNGRKHIDVWAGGDGTNAQKLYECENRWTRESEIIELNPPGNRLVNTNPLCF